MLFKRYTWSWDPQRVDINSLIDAHHATDDLMTQIASRFEILEKAFERLQVTVAVQQEFLVAAGQLNRAAIDARVDDELARLHEPAPAWTAAAETLPLLRCIRCERQVPANRTVMTANGPMCDPSCAP